VTLADVGVVPGCVEDLHAGEILQDFAGNYYLRVLRVRPR
jgi:hypothetical protein